MAATLTITRQVLAVGEVRDIVVTTIEDTGNGYMRAIRVFGAPEGTDAPAILEITLESQTKDDLLIQTPELTF